MIATPVFCNACKFKWCRSDISDVVIDFLGPSPTAENSHIRARLCEFYSETSWMPAIDLWVYILLIPTRKHVWHGMQRGFWLLLMIFHVSRGSRRSNFCEIFVNFFKVNKGYIEKWVKWYQKWSRMIATCVLYNACEFEWCSSDISDVLIDFHGPSLSLENHHARHRLSEL